MSRNEKSSSSETFVVFGTAFPEQTEKDRRAGVSDAGQFVPVWKQEARDEKGRRRFHGAFTGGFSAGYFNTVGSKEGWTPSNFVSSRSSRNQQLDARPEDFMDEEDLQELAASRQLVATDEFDMLGGTERELASRKRQLAEEERRGGGLGFLSSSLMDLVGPADDSVGIRLLRKMGWKPGQGIGPRQTQKQQGDDDDELWMNNVTFAPRDTPIVNFSAKSNNFGLGYDLEKFVPQVAEMRRLREHHGADSEQNRERSAFGVPTESGRAGFGLGAYEDDDEASVYGEETRFRDYHTALYDEDEPDTKHRSAKRQRKKSPDVDDIMSKTPCSDGRPPLKGFSVSKDSQTLGKWYTPPKVPANFTVQRVVIPEKAVADQEMPSVMAPPQEKDIRREDNAPKRQLTFEQRGEILGEKPIEPRSVFDYMSSKTKERIFEGQRAAIVDRSKLSNFTVVSKDDANLALRGFMPFGDTPEKQARYRNYLENYAGLLTDDGKPKDTLPIPQGLTYDAGMKEMEEFAKAARIFRPVSSMMSSRFTTAKVGAGAVEHTTVVGGLKTEEQWRKEKEARQLEAPEEEVKELSQEAQAAALKMYGDLTRTVKPFYPVKLVCKRFNVPNPHPHHKDAAAATAASTTSGRTQAGSHQALSERSMETMLRDRFTRVTPALPPADKNDPALRAVIPKPSERANPEEVAPSTVHTPDIGKEDAPLDYERPSMDIFKAIFENSEDEEEEEVSPPPKVVAQAETRSEPDDFIGPSAPPLPPASEEPPAPAAPFRPMFSRPSERKSEHTPNESAQPTAPQVVSEEVVVQPFKPRERTKRRHVAVSDSEENESEDDHRSKSRSSKRKHKERSHKKRSESRERHHKKKRKEKEKEKSGRSHRRHDRHRRSRYSDSDEEAETRPSLDNAVWVEKSPPPSMPQSIPSTSNVPTARRQPEQPNQGSLTSEPKPRSRPRASAADFW